MPFRCFDVAVQYFEEILLSLKKKKKGKSSLSILNVTSVHDDIIVLMCKLSVNS